MDIPFVDLKAQYQSLKPEMDATIQNVLDRTAFVMGRLLPREVAIRIFGRTLERMYGGWPPR